MTGPTPDQRLVKAIGNVIDLDAARTALADGADPDQPDGKGRTLLMKALGRPGRHQADAARDAVILLLAHGARADACDSDGVTALHLLMGSRLGTDILERLLAAGADPNATDKAGRTPLGHHRIEDLSKARGLIAGLLGAGADPNRADSPRLLHHAASVEDTEILSLLLGAGADPNLPAKHDEPALCAAARMNRTRSVRLLLEAGANPNVTDGEGRTPLNASLDVLSVYWTIEPECVLETLRLLFRYGADMNRPTVDGTSPMEQLREILSAQELLELFAASDSPIS